MASKQRINALGLALCIVLYVVSGQSTSRTSDLSALESMIQSMEQLEARNNLMFKQLLEEQQKITEIFLTAAGSRCGTFSVFNVFPNQKKPDI